MIDNLGIYRTVNVLVKQYGEDAPIHTPLPALHSMTAITGGVDVIPRKAGSTSRMSAFSLRADVNQNGCSGRGLNLQPITGLWRQDGAISIA